MRAGINQFGLAHKDWGLGEGRSDAGDRSIWVGARAVSPGLRWRPWT